MKIFENKKLLILLAILFSLSLYIHAQQSKPPGKWICLTGTGTVIGHCVAREDGMGNDCDESPNAEGVPCSGRAQDDPPN